MRHSPTVLFVVFLYVLQSANFVTRLNHQLHRNIVLRFNTTYVSDIQHKFKDTQICQKNHETQDTTCNAANMIRTTDSLRPKRARCLEIGSLLLLQQSTYPAPIGRGAWKLNPLAA